jgi:hypothetical protein
MPVLVEMSQYLVFIECGFCINGADQVSVATVKKTSFNDIASEKSPDEMNEWSEYICFFTCRIKLLGADN